MPKRLPVAATAALVLAVGGTAIAQTVQRFPDVPPDHEAYEAIEWAAEAGVTAGYDDGTFKPERPLSKHHAVVFMERFYDEILEADESDDFTRGDMMVLLKAINDGTPPSTTTTTTTLPPTTTTEPAAGAVWDGTSTFDDKAWSVTCGRGPATFTWTLGTVLGDDGTTYGLEAGYLSVLVWNPMGSDIKIDVTGPNGATKSLLGWPGGWAFLTYGNHAQADIDTGETTLEIMPIANILEPDSWETDAHPWGLAAVVSSRFPSWATPKVLQHWALSVNCD